MWLIRQNCTFLILLVTFLFLEFNSGIDQKCADWLRAQPDFHNEPKVNIQVTLTSYQMPLKEKNAPYKQQRGL